VTLKLPLASLAAARRSGTDRHQCRRAAHRCSTAGCSGGPSDGDSDATIVAAAQAFLATLDDNERAKVSFGFESSQRTGWSNLPTGIFSATACASAT
jgi:hypothetical protein